MNEPGISNVNVHNMGVQKIVFNYVYVWIGTDKAERKNNGNEQDSDVSANLNENLLNVLMNDELQRKQQTTLNNNNTLQHYS